jgi:hypothetical protein
MRIEDLRDHEKRGIRRDGAVSPEKDDVPSSPT